ncbi:unnamed protein product [Oppiella nova]|uniref:Uncharacterized protein n=1 Tax=Oppiella nova TaxID=334625 RepID=A0A7R9M7V6_9ACAR|nr:unnamed protein product [Oppiella nova]CAG2172437.1 unnamed protein product [Oppiella nova]
MLFTGIISLYYYVGSTGVSIAHLLAYCSCFNCYIYCFMHTKFREALLRMLSRTVNRQNSCVFAPNIFGDDGNDTQTSSSRQDIAMGITNQLLTKDS